MTDQDIDTAGTEADAEMDESLKNPEARPLDPTAGPLGGDGADDEKPPAPPPPAG